jgi:hypothetical protein
MAAMANRPPHRTAAVADAVRMAAPAARTLLDLGGGPGVHSRAFIARGFDVTLFDRPEVIDLVSGAYGLEDEEGLRLVGGDFQVGLPDGEFDGVFLSNISHIYGPETNRQLISRSASALAAGGCLAIVDFVRGVSGFAPLFAITMLLTTDEGGTWSMLQYSDWLEDAGLERVRCRTVQPDVQLVTAVRPEARERDASVAAYSHHGRERQS